MKDERQTGPPLNPRHIAGEGAGDQMCLSPQGVITDIHRSSVVDGPGIRTTVFLKGCPLSCTWCHNPETQACHRQLGYNASKCIGCGECEPVCPQGALLLEGINVVLDRKSCDDCLKCIDVCPADALFAYGRNVAVDDVMDLVLKDKLYYDESGGGVTVSGGEPMAQPEFTIELLRRSKLKGLHTCLDTTGIGRLEDFRKARKYVDLFLFDYKASDPEALKTMTGASMETVMRTFHMLYDSGARIRLRCPMIPGLNDNDAHLIMIAKLTATYDLEGVDILCWHTMGTAKYTYLGREQGGGLQSENTGDERKDYYRRVLMSAGASGVEIKD